MKFLVLLYLVLFTSGSLENRSIEKKEIKLVEHLSEKQLVRNLTREVRELKDKMSSEFDNVNYKLNYNCGLNREVESETGRLLKLESKINENEIKLLDEVKKGSSDVKTVLTDVLNNIESKIINVGVEVTRAKNELSTEIKNEKDRVGKELSEMKKLNEDLKSENAEIKDKISAIKNILENHFLPRRNCYDLLKKGDVESGVRIVFPFETFSNEGVEVVCDQETLGGGWTVIQSRSILAADRVDFYRNWDNYTYGFGQKSGEFWLGLYNIVHLTTRVDNELRIELEDFSGAKAFAHYSSFAVEDEDKEFQLKVDNYSGDAGDDFTFHNKQKFTTLDRENDDQYSVNCADSKKGGWWYSSCTYGNLNGYLYSEAHSSRNGNDGVYWHKFRGYESLAKTRMMIRSIV